MREQLNALPPPQASVSPQSDAVLFIQELRYPSIAEIAQPMQRLAGIRIDEQTNGLHLGPGSPSFISYALKRLPDGRDVPLHLPPNAKLGTPAWSPDGSKIAFANSTPRGIELWIADAATGRTRRIESVQLNGVTFGPEDHAMTWLGDNQTLLVRIVPPSRGSRPEAPKIPTGPAVQESLGNSGPAPTYEDLLASPTDEALFDYYATSQLAYVDVSTDAVTSLGEPRIYSLVAPSPDQKHLLIRWIHRPYSYQLPAQDFPEIVEIWDRRGQPEFRLADLPLASQVPLAGVRTGPRGYGWNPTYPATVVWAEALDGGNPKRQAAYRDHLLSSSAPFLAPPKEVFKVENRFRGLEFLSGDRALVEDYERAKRILRTLEVHLDQPGTAARIIFSRNERDAYGDPGMPAIAIDTEGRHFVREINGAIVLIGGGASADGDRPFVDAYDLATGKDVRLFQSTLAGFESPIAVLDKAGTVLLTRYESPTEPPSFRVRSGADVRVILRSPDPSPSLLGIKKQLVKFKRADGVPLSFTLYLPPDYKPGTRLPTLVWAYPYEFSDAGTAGQVTGHSDRSFPELNYHQLAVLHGYALLDGSAMPIIGDPDTVNNTYIDQLLMDAKAAVDKAVDMGVTDRARVGVFGHSYGAFMTANLVAHSDIFRAAVAESGAYNRTLTPFGFQAERRTFWQASEVYTKMSPFWFADQIKTPTLLIHGQADDNTGTYPIQSERMYSAIRGNGGIVRLVMLPSEAHGYRAQESLEHVVYEELAWFDKYLGPDADIISDQGAKKR